MEKTCIISASYTDLRSRNQVTMTYLHVCFRSSHKRRALFLQVTDLTCTARVGAPSNRLTPFDLFSRSQGLTYNSNQIYGQVQRHKSQPLHADTFDRAREDLLNEPQSYRPTCRPKSNLYFTGQIARREAVREMSIFNPPEPHMQSMRCLLYFVDQNSAIL